MLKNLCNLIFSTSELGTDFIVELIMLIILIFLCFGGFRQLVGGGRR